MNFRAILTLPSGWRVTVDDTSAARALVFAVRAVEHAHPEIARGVKAHELAELLELHAELGGGWRLVERLTRDDLGISPSTVAVHVPGGIRSEVRHAMR